MKLKKRDSYWWVELISEDGTVHEVNTYARTKEEAKKLCEESKVAKLEAAGLSHRLTADAVALITANRLIPLHEAIMEFEEWAEVAYPSVRSRTNHVDTVTQWAKEMEIEHKNVSALTERDVHDWINSEKRKDKLGTRRQKLSSIRALMKFFTAKRWLLTDPSALVRVDLSKLSHAQRETKHKDIFTDEEIEQILAKCDGAEPSYITPGFYRAAIIMARDLGLRISDIAKLESSCFDFTRNLVTLWQEKTNARIEIPMTMRVVQTVVDWPQKHERYLFPNECALLSDPTRRAIVSLSFSKFLKSAGFPGRNWHSLRSQYATTMANQGATMGEISQALGHTSPSAAAAYVKVKNAAKVNLR